MIMVLRVVLQDLFGELLQLIVVLYWFFLYVVYLILIVFRVDVFLLVMRVRYVVLVVVVKVLFYVLIMKGSFGFWFVEIYVEVVKKVRNESIVEVWE